MNTVDLPYATGSEIEGRWVTGLRRLPTEDELPCSDDIPVETTWHRDSATLLLDSVRWYSRDRADWWCAADMFLYFNLEMVKNRDFRGPDFFFVKGVPKRLRKSYVVWEEGGHFPNVIVELVSDSTREKDLGEKKAIYEKVFRTPEYFIVELDGASIQGWRLVGGKYKEIKPVGGKLRCEQLGLDIGLDPDTIPHDCLLFQPAIFPRFYYPDGRLAPTPYEAALAGLDAERQKADVERQKADAERQKAIAATNEASEANARNATLLAGLDALKARLGASPS